MSYIYVAKDNEKWIKDDLDSTGANWRIAISARGPGKSYQSKCEIIDRWLQNGETGVIIRRYDAEIKITEVSKYWKDMWNYFTPKLREKYPAMIEFDIIPKTGAWIVRGMYEDETVEVLGTLAYYLALNVSHRYKGGAIPDATTFVVEEFIPENGIYLSDEFDRLLNLISTIKRDRANVVIYCWGNTLDRNCVYFNEMNIDIRELRQGEIKNYIYYGGLDGNSINTVAIEYLRPVKQPSGSDAYFVFNRQQEKMIYNGEWRSKAYKIFAINEVYESHPQFATVLDYMKIHLYCYIVSNRDGTYTMYVSSDRLLNRCKYITLYGGQTNIISQRFNLNSRIEGIVNLKNFIYELYLNDLVYFDNNLTGVDFEKIISDFAF